MAVNGAVPSRQDVDNAFLQFGQPVLHFPGSYANSTHFSMQPNVTSQLDHLTALIYTMLRPSSKCYRTLEGDRSMTELT